MDLFLIQGGTRLSGTARVHGSKNAALPIMAASLLTEAPLTLTNVPDLVDIHSMLALLDRLGVSLSANLASSRVVLQADDPSSFIAPYDLVRKMRASICVLGPLLARRRQAIVSLPGGCAIGHRPIDLHLKGLAALGADIRIERGYVIAQAEKLRGTTIDLSGPNGTTVTGTCNLLCAAVLAQGVTMLTSAAREPEVVDLGELLNRMGARIEGLGTSTLVIDGVDELHGAKHEIIPDRIEAATLLIAAAITGGDVTLEGIRVAHFKSVIEALSQMGCMLTVSDDCEGVLRLQSGQKLSPIHLATGAYPAFPTDVQAQLMALATLATGTSRIVETVFPDRFMHVSELVRLGAHIEQQGHEALIRGGKRLLGAPLMASDLRASAALVLAGLAAEGQTVLRRIYHLDRGYQRLDETLNRLGASIKRVPDVPELIPEDTASNEFFPGPHWLTRTSGESQQSPRQTRLRHGS